MAIVRRYEGGDLVISQAELAALGLVPGQCVSIRRMTKVSLIEPLRAGEREKRQVDLNTAWGRASQDEQVDAESAHEDLWQQWSGDR